MRYLSVCSGIEAASLTCVRCEVPKPRDAFHKNRRLASGLQSWCKECNKQFKRDARARREKPEDRRAANLKQRYGISLADYENMLARQDGKCAICTQPPNRPVVDHCHSTGRVRGILCLKCNAMLPAIEDGAYLAGALRYLGGGQ